MPIWRRIRGFLGTAFSWAVLWLVIGAALAVYALVRDESDASGVALQFIGWVSLFYAAWGAISGGVFALVLAAAERRRSLNELSMLRVIMWGAVGALAMPVLYIVFMNAVLSIQLVPSVVFFAVTAGLGSVSAAATLGLARRAPRELTSKSPDGGSLTSA